MFSSTIKISSVSDYIQPSQECIKPLLDKAKLNNTNDLFQQPQTELTMKPNLIKKNHLQVAKVSLSDCLACSGCITTAETMLIESHSEKEFLKQLSLKDQTIIAISPQSRASIAVYFQLNELQAHQLIQGYFDSLQKNIILVDMHSLVELALQLSKGEFLATLDGRGDLNLPLLCSECPGWVCYAEKTLEPQIIKHMSQVKSPQQLFGKLMREIYCVQKNLNKDNLYLVTIMPCYDKKLESVRQQNAGEVDTVLSTGELLELLKDNQYSPNSKLHSIEELLGVSQRQELFYFDQDKQYGNDTSNRYLDFIIESFIISKQLKDYQILSQQRKNGDFIEIFVKENDIVVGTFARVYGLKNIANLVTQIKNNTCKYLYVEVMACPSGCINGGGQIKIKQTKEYKQKEYIQQMMDVLTCKNSKIARPVEANELLSIVDPTLTVTTFQHIPKNLVNFEW